MKIRKGFVSNSSSSSFMILATQDYFEEMIQGLSKEDQEVVRRSMRPTHQFGKDLFYIEAYCSTEDPVIRGLHGLDPEEQGVEYGNNDWYEMSERVCGSYDKILGALRPQGAREGQSPGIDERAFWTEEYR